MKKLFIIMAMALFVASVTAVNAAQVITGVERINNIPAKSIEVYANSSFLVLKTADGTPTLAVHHYAEYNNDTGELSVTQNTQKKTGRYTHGDQIASYVWNTTKYGNFTVVCLIWNYENTYTNDTWCDEIVAATVTQEGPYYPGMSELIYNQTAVTLSYPIYNFVSP